MNIEELLQKAVLKLKDYNIEESHSKARRLLAFTLKIPKEQIIIHNKRELTIQQVNQYNMYIERILLGEPIQYIIGKQEFMGIDFKVTPDVLIPQPDTEILVEKVIEILEIINNPKVLDLCTGSGAIAVSIAKYVPKSTIFAADISKKALEIAKQNDIANKVKFICSNLFENINSKFNVIVSNPPYIKTSEIQGLSKEVQNEPLIALDGGQDGLFFYRAIITQAHEYLENPGYLCLEIGEDQKEQVIELINSSGCYKNIQSFKDFSGHDRVIICKKIKDEKS